MRHLETLPFLNNMAFPVNSTLGNAPGDWNVVSDMDQEVGTDDTPRFAGVSTPVVTSSTGTLTLGELGSSGDVVVQDTIAALTITGQSVYGNAGQLGIGTFGSNTSVGLGASTRDTVVYSTTASTNTGNGSLVVYGGIGVAGGINASIPCAPHSVHLETSNVGTVASPYYLVPSGASAGWPHAVYVSHAASIRRLHLVVDNEFVTGFNYNPSFPLEVKTLTLTLYVNGTSTAAITIADQDALWTGAATVADPQFSQTYKRIQLDNSVSMDSGSFPITVSAGSDVVVGFAISADAETRISGSECAGQLDFLYPLATS